MASRRSLLIVPPLLALAGWAATRTGPAPARACGGCHEPHFAEAGTCASCHRGDPAALRKEIAHHRLLTGRAAAHARNGDPAVPEGERLIERLACRRCHVVAGTGNRLATNLDRVVRRREQADVASAIRAPVQDMPRFGLEKEQLETVFAYLLRSAEPGRAETAYRVRFGTGAPRYGSVFEERCGGCHRALTVGGPLGRGTAGPNLSGLLTPHYPRTAGREAGWSVQVLGRWIENPRSQRPDAAMRPVRVDDEARERLAGELRASGADEPDPEPSVPGRPPGPAGGIPDRGGPASAREGDLRSVSSETFRPFSN